MKLNFIQKQRSAQAKPGFTLVEIMVVIAILAMLAAGAWQATAWIKNKRSVSLAENQVSMLEQGMNAYKMDNGGYLPAGKGDEWSAHVLYSILFCDADNDGEPDKDPQSDSRLNPYCNSIVVIKNTKEAEGLEGIPAIKRKILGAKGIGDKAAKGNKYFVIMDPWNNAYRYRLGYEAESKDGTGKGMNPDFDIFSQGPDKRGDSRTTDGDNSDNVSNIRLY